MNGGIGKPKTGVMMMTSKKDAAKLNKVVSKVLTAMKPPDSLTVTEWAEKKRRLSSESSAEPGLWRTERTPYLRGPMDAFTDARVQHIVLVSASQIGKSEFINNVIGYIIDEDPGSILFPHPTTIDAKDYSKLRIAPMIRDCPSLKKKVSDPKSRDSSNTILQKTYPGGILTLCGSTEAHALASKPIRYIMGDERDRWARSAGTEGDPWELARARQTTFYNAKAIEVSTPTIKNASAIEAAYAEGTMERWKSQCPHCGEYHEINFDYIRYEHEEKIIAGEKTFKILKIWYICAGCGCISEELTMKRQPARWEASNPDAYLQGTRSFWLNAFVSPWATWESIILKYLKAIGDSKKLQVVYNTCFGWLWEDRGDLEDEDSILKRREEYSAELPDGVLVLTCGVDTQDDRLEYEVVGRGFFGERWGIKKGIIMGRPDDDNTWLILDDVIDHIYRFQDGIGLRISRTFVDEGGHFTQEVRIQCRARMGKNVFCIKGYGGPDKPYTSPPKKQKIVINQKFIGTCWQYQLGVDAGKQKIIDYLHVQTSGARYSHFPKRDDYGPDYFKSLLSERKEYNPNLKHPWEWKKLPGHERNEAFDCRNYADAAFETLPANLDEIDRKLKAARGIKLEPVVALPAVSTKNTVKKRRGSALDKLYEEW